MRVGAAATDTRRGRIGSGMDGYSAAKKGQGTAVPVCSVSTGSQPTPGCRVADVLLKHRDSRRLLLMREERRQRRRQSGGSRAGSQRHI